MRGKDATREHAHLGEPPVRLRGAHRRLLRAEREIRAQLVREALGMRGKVLLEDGRGFELGDQQPLAAHAREVVGRQIDVHDRRAARRERRDSARVRSRDRGLERDRGQIRGAPDAQPREVRRVGALGDEDARPAPRECRLAVEARAGVEKQRQVGDARRQESDVVEGPGQRQHAARADEPERRLEARRAAVRRRHAHRAERVGAERAGADPAATAAPEPRLEPPGV